MTTTIIRLKNTGKGQPYGIERAEDLDGETAAQQTEVWWESAGTIAMCIVIDGEEDSRYEKQYLDESRVPEGWVAKQAKKKDMPKAAIPVAPPSRPMPPPTLVNPEPKAAEKRAACADCYRTGKPRDEAPEGNVRHCTACLIPFTSARFQSPRMKAMMIRHPQGGSTIGAAHPAEQRADCPVEIRGVCTPGGSDAAPHS